MKFKSPSVGGARRKSWLVGLLMAGHNLNLPANPTDMTVVSGTALPPQTSGLQMNVTIGPVTFLNWSTFNIQAGETTTFLQPSANSVVINQIGDANPSQIFGNLNANGTVILANANGFYFGSGSMIKVGGSFIATTAPLTPDFGAGSAWQFTGMPPLKSIVNYGQVSVGNGQSLYLIADQIENRGSLTAPGGDVGLLACQEVFLNDRADGRGFGATVKLPSGSVNNFGQITADAGTIALQAQVVNQNGIIQADSVQNENGVIELVASGSLNLGANSVISANGDSTAGTPSPGGFVVLKSGNTIVDTPASTVTVSGQNGGQDGVVEVFSTGSIQSTIGSHFLELINPYDVTLSQDPTDASSSNPNINVDDLAGYSRIALFAADKIELATTWALSDPGMPASLDLVSGNNLVLDNLSSITADNDWSLSLVAGAGFVPTTAQPVPVSGNDGIFLNGNADIQTQNGDISLFAAQDVKLVSGYVNTANGGNIFVNALYGDINAGNNNAGALINGSTSLSVNPELGYFGGISTVSGGDVNLDAGHDVISVPNASTRSNMTPGASGAYGGGNVTVVAGDAIIGNFLVSDGTGKLEAGVAVDQNNSVTINNPAADIGTAQRSVTLSLISGNWDVFAARNLYISEINNPNGTFDSSQSISVPPGTFAGNIDPSGRITAPPSRSTYLFNYAADSGALFWAGDSMTLGNGITRLPSQSSQTSANAIYPPSLSLIAGAGGITLDTSIILYPSSQGSLNITDAGNLAGQVVNTTPTGITMSDSGLPDYRTFGTGHAVRPLHQNDPNPVTLNIAGSIGNFDLTVPTFANISVGGATPFTTPSGRNIFGTYNFGFSGQNLSASAVTRITVAGDIIYQGLVSSVSLSDYDAAPLPAEWFDVALSTDPSVAQYLTYDAATGLLSLRGPMPQQDLTLLQNLTFSATSGGQTSLTSGQQAALAALYNFSQGVDAYGGGISLNGLGNLAISAQNMDLGTSAGIQVNQIFLSQLFANAVDGASLDLKLLGNLEMTTTAIANSGWLGGIQLTAGGTIDVGQQALFGEAGNVPRGIYTASAGNISVTAAGDVNVDGSRIAAYDGGNITVISQHGDVNAGSGGNGDVEVDTELQLGPDGRVTTLTSGKSDKPGSGIMATTDGASALAVGNITVQALEGSINADVGGIEQIAFNHVTSPDNFIDLDAGKDISAGNSGVIGSNIRTRAGGSISGLFVGSGTVTVNAGQNFSGTIVGSTAVSVVAGGTVSGTIVGGDNVSVSGGDITANLISGSVSTAGDASGASMGIPQSNVTKENTQATDDASTIASKTDSQDDDEKKKKGKEIALAQKTSRVTVILPPKP